jgi:DNA mismatch repair protein MutH
MNLETAIARILEIERTPLGEIFSDEIRSEIANGKINKGYSGQILELAIGLKLGSSLRDLDNGEIKTTILKNNFTKESIPITMLNHLLDEIQADANWIDTKVFKKIQNVLIVPCHKNSRNWREWYFDKPIHISFESHPKLYIKFEEDYKAIAANLRHVINSSLTIHTTNGPNYFLQIRTKDNKPYRPLEFENKILSPKQHAIFFTSRFVRELVDFHRGTKGKSRHKLDLPELLLENNA